MAKRKSSALVASLLALAVFPASARAAGLECMADRYDEARLAQLETMAPGFNFMNQGGKAVASKLGEAIGEDVQACVAENEWSEEQAGYAMFYEFGRVSEYLFRHSGSLERDELRKLDSALQSKGNDTLWQVVERGVVGEITGKGAGMTDQDNLVMGQFMLSSGLPMEAETGEKVGVLLGTIALQRVTQRAFDNIGENQ